MAVDLTTRYLGMTLRNPLVVSSSPLTGCLTTLKRLEEVGAAAVVLPSLFEEQLTGKGAEQHPAGSPAASKSAAALADCQPSLNTTRDRTNGLSIWNRPSKPSRFR